jgi:hypothetical protein
VPRHNAFYVLHSERSRKVASGVRRGTASRGARISVVQLAEALESSPGWKDIPGAVLVVRPGPEPALAVMGAIDGQQRTRLEGLQWLLDRILPRLRYVSYKQAEADCERLASRLRDRFGRQELAQFEYRAIPRGGCIVLGMLAYVLDLTPRQLEAGGASDAPLCLVDDCAISGARFSRHLQHWRERRIVFAHLYSHPELRAEIERQEPAVLACVSAHDLVDHAPEHLGAEYDAWKQRWRERPGAGYWTGQPDYVCFAWNEPDLVVWNPGEARDEVPWRFLPPRLCLKNRRRPAGVRVQVQTGGRGPLKPSARALFAELNGRILVADMEAGESFELSSVAGDMWLALMRTGRLEKAEEILLRQYAVSRMELRADLTAFVSDLRRRGLLEDGEVRERMDS